MDINSFNKVRKELIEKSIAAIKRADETEKALRFSQTLVQREIHLARLQIDVQLNKLETKAQMTLKSVVAYEIQNVHELVAQFYDVIESLKSPSMAIPDTKDILPQLTHVSKTLDQLTNKLKRKKVKFQDNKELEKSLKVMDTFGEFSVVNVLPIAKVIPEMNKTSTTNYQPLPYRFDESIGSQNGICIDEHKINGTRNGIKDDPNMTAKHNGEIDTLALHDGTSNPVLGNVAVNPFAVLRALQEKQHKTSMFEEHVRINQETWDDLGVHYKPPSQDRTCSVSSSSCKERNTEERTRLSRKSIGNDNQNLSNGIERVHMAPSNSRLLDKHSNRADKSYAWRRSRSVSPNSARSYSSRNTDNKIALEELNKGRNNTVNRGNVKKSTNQERSKENTLAKITSNEHYYDSKLSSERRININPMDIKVKYVDSPKLDRQSVVCKPNRSHSDHLSSGKEDSELALHKNSYRQRAKEDMQSDTTEDASIQRKKRMQMKRLRNRTINTIEPVNHSAVREDNALSDDKDKTTINTIIDEDRQIQKSENSQANPNHENKHSHFPSVSRVGSPEIDRFVSHYCTLRRRRKERQVNNDYDHKGVNSVLNIPCNSNAEGRDKNLQSSKKTLNDDTDGTVLKMLSGDEGKALDQLYDDGFLETPGINVGHKSAAPGDKPLEAKHAINGCKRPGHKYDSSTRRRLPSFKEMLFSSNK